MESSSYPTHKVYNDPFRFYFSMLRDIERAEKCIYLEIYRFNNDAIGIRFRNTLLRKAREGVKIKILVDSWGTRVRPHFFRDLIEAGAEVRYYKKIKLFVDFFTKNHRRNHRKILLIDHNISYIGSANISEYSLNWRESVLRVTGGITQELEKVFKHDFINYNKYQTKKGSFLKILNRDGFTIIRDFPSIRSQKIMRYYLDAIRKAREEVLIETPYFLPGYQLRRAMMRAAQRGVNVTVIMPMHSDVRMIDVLRSRYLGPMNENGIKILFYREENLHAKNVLVDREWYAVGSANFDYRSFRYQHEIMITGEHQNIANQLYEHIMTTINNSVSFSYQAWLARPKIQKLFEYVLLPFRHLL
ncbi:MAG: phosphatidylserine/phosphatidylglycerophosphate/cardiolipin synthase family protein [Bacteroidales bacterium]|nr:phosphatidylserine/phosphatidylglycerophosphate/cardiolipin synthase family protein [Bacteroidales bacterium]MCF8332600.1 phosphatidylserine/phosphatidylglycerophosphate/cardiolipin synthase family protein [Bacteroidales bacterium]